jgi:hypothetical protein
MTPVGYVAILLAVLSVLSALGLIHLQNQINRLRRSQHLLSEAVSIGINSLLEYIDAIQREKN